MNTIKPRFHVPHDLKYLSEAQWRLLMGTWLKVRDVLIGLGGMEAKEADAERKKIITEATGIVDLSSKELTNRQLDRVLDAMNKRLIVTDHTKAARAITQPVQRLLHGIANFPEDQVRGLCRRNFQGREDFENFTESELMILRTQLTQWRRQQKEANPF